MQSGGPTTCSTTTSSRCSNRCSVFALWLRRRRGLRRHRLRNDEFDVLDLLDSLVRKSLITIEEARGRSRYGMLETIRQFAADQLVASGCSTARCATPTQRFASPGRATLGEFWEGPRDPRLGRLVRDRARQPARRVPLGRRAQRPRRGHRLLAAHGVMLGQSLQAFEPVVWCEGLIPEATKADVRQLPRLYTAAQPVPVPWPARATRWPMPALGRRPGGDRRLRTVPEQPQPVPRGDHPLLRRGLGHRDGDLLRARRGGRPRPRPRRVRAGVGARPPGP